MNVASDGQNGRPGPRLLAPPHGRETAGSSRAPPPVATPGPSGKGGPEEVPAKKSLQTPFPRPYVHIPRQLGRILVAFESVPTVLTAQQVLDKAYGRASKIEKSDREAGHRHRKTLLARFEAIRNILDDTLGRYVKRFPSLDQVSPYHRELIKLLIGEDAYRMNLGSVDAARERSIKLLNRSMQYIRHETDREVLTGVMKRTYARVASMVEKCGPSLVRLNDFRATLRRLPTVTPGLYTVVIAGHPNVGKSSLIRALTNAEPEVASYPFTTKAANVGHLEIRREGVRFAESHVRIQLIDTPGLLDRPEEDRNAIEHQAALALKHLADLIVFVRDPTGHCGYPVEAQERLLEEVRTMTEGVPIAIIETKSDLGDPQGHADAYEAPLMRVSTVTHEGIPELTDHLVKTVTAEPDDPELEAYLRGESLPSHRVGSYADQARAEEADGETPLPSFRMRKSG